MAAAVAISCITAAALAATIGPRKYSFATLTSMWQDHIGPPNQQWYADALSRMEYSYTDEEPWAEETDDGWGNPIMGVGDDSPDGVTGWATVEDDSADQRYYFYTVDMPAAYAAHIAKREIALHLFLNREADYEPPSYSDEEEVDFAATLGKRVDAAEQRRVLDGYVCSAMLELFLIELARYQEARTAQAKCHYLERAVELEQSMAEDPAACLDSAWLSLLPVYNQAKTRFQEDLGHMRVCRLPASLSSVEHRQKIKQSANELIGAKLTAETETTVRAINTKKEGLQQHRNTIQQIDTLTGELLQLEGELKDTKSNIELVHFDSFAVGGILSQLQAELGTDANGTPKTFSDYPAFRNLKDYVPPEVGNVHEAAAQLTERLREILAVFATTVDLLPADYKAAHAEELDACRLLDEETNAPPEAGQVAALLYQCLTALDGFVQERIPLNASEQRAHVFGRQLEELSAAVLSTMAGSY